MSFLKRLLGGRGAGEPAAHAPVDQAEAEAAERQYELDLLRQEHDRMDELTLRQQRYADFAWTPPPEGGERRADDTGRPADEAS